MRAKVLVLATALGVVMTVPVLAHHSFGSEYDEKKPLKFENVTVTKLEWTNPHARFYVDVKDAKGVVTNWNFELASPNVLKRNGWTKNTLKEGDKVITGPFTSVRSLAEGAAVKETAGETKPKS